MDEQFSESGIRRIRIKLTHAASSKPIIDDRKDEQDESYPPSRAETNLISEQSDSELEEELDPSLTTAPKTTYTTKTTSDEKKSAHEANLTVWNLIDTLETNLKGKDIKQETEQRRLAQEKAEEMREREREMRIVREAETQREQTRNMIEVLERERTLSRMNREQQRNDIVKLRLRDNHAAMNAFEKTYRSPLKRCSRKDLMEFYTSQFPITSSSLQEWETVFGSAAKSE